MRRFDRKFGRDFLKGIPEGPGVYFFRGVSGEVLYVGKAVNLRRRLAQYRNAVRKKRSRKMMKVVSLAESLTWETSDTELDACLNEIRLIQELRPPHNIAGAYSFLYPLVGMKKKATNVELGGSLSFPEIHFCFTTSPGELSEYRFFGAFRSRETTAEAFFSLMRLLRFVGHPVSSGGLTAKKRPAYSYIFGFRRLPALWFSLWEEFFRGRSLSALEELTLTILGNAGARARAEEVQEDINSLHRFWKDEASLLAAAIDATGYGTYPVPQSDRDPLFLRFRMAP